MAEKGKPKHRYCCLTAFYSTVGDLKLFKNAVVLVQTDKGFDLGTEKGSKSSFSRF